ncbi:MAG TPA: hypothetical protein VLV83_17655 [Acidobacteriota bacterium]|nr:hypothetical protein [Acidobacteriota bacterium]
MIVVWIIFIWVLVALLYGVISVLRQARQDASRRRSAPPKDTASESSAKDSRPSSESE